MAVKFEKTEYGGDMPVFWRGEAKILPGGFRLTQTFPKGTIIRKGTFLQIDLGKLEATIAKVGNVIAGGAANRPYVKKNSYFQSGDTIMKEGESSAVTISSINSSNSEYDVLNLSGSISGLSAGDTLVEASSGDETEGAFTPNAVVGENTEPLNGDGDDTVSAAYDAVVLLGYIPEFPDSWLQGITLKNNPNIVFAKQ